MLHEVFRAHAICAVQNNKNILHNLDISIKKGEVLGIWGSSFSSGKTALLDIISGKLCPSKGELFFNGVKMQNFSHSKAIRPTIVRLSKKSNYILSLSLWENFSLVDSQYSRKFLLNPSSVQTHIANFFSQYGINLNPESTISMLTPFQRFYAELLYAKYRSAEIILIDNLTLECSYQEYLKLHNLIMRLCSEGMSFVLTGTSIHQLCLFSNRLAFMDNGNLVFEIENTSENEDTIKRCISALSPVNTTARSHKGPLSEGLLSIRNITTSCGQMISLDLCEGETLAIIDPSKSASRIFEIPFTRKGKRSDLIYKGRSLSPYERRKFRRRIVSVDISYVDKVIDCLTVAENICINQLSKITKFGILRPRIMSFITQKFFQWYQNSEINSSTTPSDLHHTDRVALSMYRLSLYNPSIVVFKDYMWNTDKVSQNLIETCISELNRRKIAVCTFVSIMEHFEDFADRYIVIASDGIYYDVPYDHIFDYI